ncbi:Oidioi.mRNA.OKI2018_I69.chr2.g5037.t1.cds [Oikopleura dioica]|uniref:Dol-P-Glc:Glc(2)Man(9)GlcNAc(2)-PP-Dol alpha-1,2-glucosyltransferase n=1 Tax=Oikopleura dioica TaxID=34765 RepID=A0ABN7T5S3_OIKDI|nr:Oidioi.mRNA.OKI2018_I69.chr2.g5037.t1.cds [Oikopleura dioica]
MLSLFFRQTNIVWLFFTSCISFMYSNSPTGQAIRGVDREILAIEIKPWRKYFWEEVASVGIHLLYRLFLDIASLKYIFSYTFPLFSCAGAFLIFLKVNGSIVLGDKDAHTAVFNPAQLLYFSLFTCIFALPCFLANLVDVLKFFYRNILKLLVLSVLSYLIIANFDVVHPYNLADNRHFCFYAWRYLHKYRTFLAPVYGASILGVTYLLPRSFLWNFAFWLCTAASVVPQKLFEFRYFMVPFTIVLLFSQKLSYKLQILWNLLLLATWVYFFRRKK